VGAKRFEDLVVWQIADELRTEVYRLAAFPAASRDFDFRRQLMSAAGSVAANIAEGFARRSPRDFARHLKIAAGSAAETSNWLDDGCARGYWSANEAADARRILRRLGTPLQRLIRYLSSAER
jgi:four helix bundle protein